MMTKGDILKGEKTNHPIVYLNKRDDFYFIGCILTHSSTKEYKNNISLLPQHFETIDENNNNYMVIYDGTYFVKLQLLKKEEWGRYKKVGKLNNSGINFIEMYIKHSDPVAWRDYLSRIK